MQKPSLSQILELGFQLEAGNNYYSKDIGSIRLGIVERDGLLWLSRDPFLTTNLDMIESIDELRKTISAAEFLFSRN